MNKRKYIYLFIYLFIWTNTFKSVARESYNPRTRCWRGCGEFKNVLSLQNCVLSLQNCVLSLQKCVSVCKWEFAFILQTLRRVFKKCVQLQKCAFSLQTLRRILTNAFSLQTLRRVLKKRVQFALKTLRDFETGDLKN